MQSSGCEILFSSWFASQSHYNLNLFATPIKKGSTERPAVIHGYYGAKLNRAHLHGRWCIRALCVPNTVYISFARPYKRRTHFASDFMFTAILPAVVSPIVLILTVRDKTTHCRATIHCIRCEWHTWGIIQEFLADRRVNTRGLSYEIYKICEI